MTTRAPRAAAPPPSPGSVGVVAPLGRDARLMTDRLRSGGLGAQAYGSLGELCDGLDAGRIGAALMTSESVGGPAAARLSEWLRSQPPWSDLPVVLLIGPRQTDREGRRLLGAIGARASATVLERPVPSSALVAAVRLTLLDRRRQLEVGDLLEALDQARAALESRVAERTREVRRLAAELTLAEHSERRRIAHLLHDDIQQRLHGLSVTLSLLERALGTEPGPRLLAQAQATLRGTTDLTRSLSHELAPPILRGEGLRELLEWIAAHTHERYGLDVDVAVEDGVTVAREDVRVLLSQVIGELMLNAAKHAGVSRVRIEAEAVPGGQAVRVTVSDQGQGFDVSGAGLASSGMGLTSVRERAELVGGRFTIDSAPGRGTRAMLEMPAAADGLGA